MREVEVPLLCFGPPRLRAWLHEHWDELSDASRTALSQLVSGPALQSGQAPGELPNLAANLDYEHILSALSDQDFCRFVEDVLENPGDHDVEKQYPYPPGLDEMEEHPAALRQRLRLCFSRSRLYPQEDFAQLIERAAAELTEAFHRLTEVGLGKNLLQHIAAVVAIHNAVDRALLAAERFVELTVEFLALAAQTLGVAADEDVQRWLAREKPGSKNRPKAWGDRLEETSQIARVIIDGKWEVSGLPSYWFQLIDFCREWVRNKKKSAGDALYPALHYLGSIFHEIKGLRNAARHASQGLKEENGFPAVYADVVKEGHKLLLDAQRRLRDVNIPAVVRVAAYAVNCFGGLELNLLSARGFLTARYAVENATRDFGFAREDVDAYLAFRKGEPECFLFPAPAPATCHVWDPLIVRRLRPARALPGVVLRFEDVEPLPEQEEMVAGVAV